MSIDLKAEIEAVTTEEPPVQPSFYPQPAALAEVTEEGKFPAEGEPGPLYYDIPMVKPPTWRWEVVGYFYLGGLSAGAYLISRLAERFGGRRFEKLARAGTTVAALSFIPCTPLLIKDLGDPKRFHHMLRIFKPMSPMNLGSWMLTGYGGAITAAALRDRMGNNRNSIAGKALGLVDVAGVPFAIMVAAYTGVLTSTASTPVWMQNAWLGPLFSATALHNGAEAVKIALTGETRRLGFGVREEIAADDSLHTANVITRAAEAATLAGYLASAGDEAKPLIKGKYAPHIWAGAVGLGLAVPQILDTIASAQKNKGSRKWLRFAGAAAGLIGSLALKWAVVYSGHDSAKDPRAARRTTMAR